MFVRLVGFVFFGFIGAGAVAQEGFAVQAQPSPGGGRMSREQMMAMRAAQMQAAAQAGQPAQAKPEGEKPKEEKKEGEGDKKKDDDKKTIKRPTDKTKPDAAELKVSPDKDGMVQFNFRNQPWPEVLDWYAAVSKKSLDWQELPADTLNLSTQRRYTLDETRNLLNRHLLARGFTMIAQGDVLSVIKTDKIDPSSVPRVEPDDLDNHLPYDFARTRFKIPDSMEPAKAVEDVKVLLNPTAKVTPLLATKQLQIIDAVTNLRDVRDLLYGEEMAASKDVRPRPFQIEHRRADYIADQIMIVLGLDPSSRKSPMEMQVEQQRMQLMMQLQQRGQDVSKMMKQQGPEVFIAVDKRRNVLLVNAPPKEMEIIERTVKQFDVPENGIAGAEPGSDGKLTLRRHSTVTVSPDAIVNALKDMGSLDPLTQLQSDSDSKTIFAYATEADHKTIEAMIDKLDGSGRRLHVVWLNRRTPADQIAGTIKALMVGEKKKEENRRPYFYYFDYYNRNNDEQTDSGFRIQPDVDNNRLLLWATDEEYGEVSVLLKELGAVASDNKNPAKIRVLDARTPEETARLLEQLKKSWGGSNEIHINVAPPASDARPEKPAAKKAQPAEAPKDKLTGFDCGGRAPFALLGSEASAPRIRFVADAIAPETQSPAAKQAEAAPTPAAERPAKTTAAPEKAPPINITVTPEGKIVITCEDPAALDQLEDLLGELEPQQRQFETFRLKHARAFDVYLNLKDYFEDELSEDKNNFMPWWYDERPKTEEQSTLGKRRKLRFVYDSDSNTIVVQNASPAQLEVIRKLIDIYDQPMNEDEVARRKTDIVPIKYSHAQDIATAIKEVYRDLLSSKDKEFQQKGEGEKGQGRSESRYRFFGGFSDDEKSAPLKMSFEGALSIGVDEISNTLIISAEEQIWTNIRDLALALDEKAKPNTVVQIHELQSGMSSTQLQKALATALAQPWPGGKPQAANAQNGKQGENNNNNGDRGRGDRGDRGRSRDGDRGDRGNRD
jgi:type II secretory pathway component GspD/PulD (secretin)